MSFTVLCFLKQKYFHSLIYKNTYKSPSDIKFTVFLFMNMFISAGMSHSKVKTVIIYFCYEHFIFTRKALHITWHFT